MKRLLITGGSGFIGSNFVRRFLKTHPDWKITNLDLLSYCGNPQNHRELDENPRYEFVQGDIRNTEIVDSVIGGSTKTFRGWFFCLAFVSIGLETNFRQLLPHLRGGKPLILYACGQTLNLILTLAMAWLMFKVIFRDMIDRVLP